MPANTLFRTCVASRTVEAERKRIVGATVVRVHEPNQFAMLAKQS
jgi:hypothetical protein